VETTRWYEIVVSFSLLAILFAEAVRVYSQLFVLSYFFGFVFVAFVPGYCLVMILFPKNQLDLAEEAVLSIALSFSLAGLTGLFLGLSPIGISLTSATVSLGAIALVLATVAFLRRKRNKELREPEV
jgi:uncharacterized membrane protein